MVRWIIVEVPNQYKVELKSYLAEKEVKGPNGEILEQLVLDTERVYWKTHNVASPYFGRSVLELKQFENCALDCFNHMSAPRAQVLAKQITQGVLAYKYSIDAKSSESQRDKNNASMTLGFIYDNE